MRPSTGLTAALLLLVLVAGLVVYKSAGAIRQIDYARANRSISLNSHVVAADGPAAPLRVAARSVNYVAVIWPALVFGILISAGVRAFIPAGAVARAWPAHRERH
jgi:hypothetical protein